MPVLVPLLIGGMMGATSAGVGRLLAPKPTAASPTSTTPTTPTIPALPPTTAATGSQSTAAAGVAAKKRRARGTMGTPGTLLGGTAGLSPTSLLGY